MPSCFFGRQTMKTMNRLGNVAAPAARGRPGGVVIPVGVSRPRASEFRKGRAEFALARRTDGWEGAGAFRRKSGR